MEIPRFYYDISSVFAYLSAERIGKFLPDADWRPIYLAGLFKLNGRQSWFLSDEKEIRMMAVDARTEKYGLPPISWPTTELPGQDLLALARAATVSKREGCEVPFALEAFRTLYRDGRDPSSPDELRRIAGEVGMDPDAMFAAMTRPDIKDQLRRMTDEAHELGVPGVPAFVIGDEVFWGDDRLEDALITACL
jgi:2-hydroxychromene-2-carboxylate isomerase